MKNKEHNDETKTPWEEREQNYWWFKIESDQKESDALFLLLKNVIARATPHDDRFGIISEIMQRYLLARQRHNVSVSRSVNFEFLTLKKGKQNERHRNNATK